MYLAKVTRVEPALQCAFVEFDDGERHGFLAFNQIHPDYYQVPVSERAQLASDLASQVRQSGLVQLDDLTRDIGSAREKFPTYRSAVKGKSYSIKDVIKRRQVMLVQVVRAERDRRGAAVSTLLSLAGKFLILMPNLDVGLQIGSDIYDSEDRLRLQGLEQDIEVSNGMGVLVKANAARMPDPQIVDDYRNLVEVWEQVRDRTLRSRAPALVYNAQDRIVPAD